MAGDAPWVAVTLGGKTRKLCYDLNAMCALEEKLGTTWDEVMMAVQNQQVGARMVRTLVTVGLMRFWPDVTEEEVGKLLTTANISEVSSAVTASISIGQPDVETEEARPTEGRVAEHPLDPPAAELPEPQEPQLVSTSG